MYAKLMETSKLILIMKFSLASNKAQAPSSSSFKPFSSVSNLFKVRSSKSQKLKKQSINTSNLRFKVPDCSDQANDSRANCGGELANLLRLQLEHGKGERAKAKLLNGTLVLNKLIRNNESDFY